jgi:hypothetical protein
MAKDDNDYIRSIIFQFLREVLRLVYVVFLIYAFYKIVIGQPETFANFLTFIVTWITFYASVVVVTIGIGYVNEERHPKTYIRQVFLAWPIYFGITGIVVFYLLPFALPSLTLLFL